MIHNIATTYKEKIKEKSKAEYTNQFIEPQDKDLHWFLSSLERNSYFYTVYDIYFNGEKQSDRTTSVNIYKEDPDLKNKGIDDDLARKFAHRIVHSNSGLKPFIQRGQYIEPF